MQGVLEIVSNERSRQKYQIFLEESRYGLGKLDQNDLFYRAERSLLANKLILSDLKDKSTDQIAFASIEGKVSNMYKVCSNQRFQVVFEEVCFLAIFDKKKIGIFSR